MPLFRPLIPYFLIFCLLAGPAGRQAFGEGPRTAEALKAPAAGARATDPAIPQPPAALGEVRELPSLAERLQTHVATLAADSMEGRGLGTEGKVRAKHYIARQFEEAGLRPLGEDFFQPLDLRIGLAWVPAVNVVGYLPGSDPALTDEYIVIGAHYDHLGYQLKDGERVIFPGADDNASGTAAVMELARLFAESPQRAGRSLVFIAFDGEESGLLGAREFLQQNGLIPNDQIQFMFSLDMVGMYEANNGLNLPGMGTLQGGGELAARVAGGHGLRIKGMTAEIPRRTDTGPFGEKGIPAAHAFTGSKSPYHKPEDTWDLLDYQGMARITLFLYDLVSEFATAPALAPSPAFARMADPKAPRLHAGLLTHTGSGYHEFPEDFYQANTAFSWGAGLFLELHLGRRVSLQPELLYDRHASRSAEGTYRRHSLMAPLHLNLTLAGGPAEMGRLFVNAGGYYRHSFAGRDGEDGLDLGGTHPEGEWGLSFGFGLEVMGVRAGITWRSGLTDIAPQGLPKATTRGTYFTLGYRF
jgi:hypothetical protein